MDENCRLRTEGGKGLPDTTRGHPAGSEDNFMHPMNFVSAVLEVPEPEAKTPSLTKNHEKLAKKIKIETPDVEKAANATPELVLVKAEKTEAVVKTEPNDDVANDVGIKIEPIDNIEQSSDSESAVTSKQPTTFLVKVKEEKKDAPSSEGEDPPLAARYIDHRKNPKKKLCVLKLPRIKFDPNNRPLNKDTRPFVCLECGHHFIRNADLNVHYRTHTGYRPFACDICGLKFTQKGNLTRHTRTHTGDKPFECDTCGMRFAQKNLLKMHFRVHTGDRPFQCKECGQSFTTKSLVVTHYRTHTGERPFSCSECEKSFAQKHTLQCHMRVHTGDKPYVCELCDKTFRFRNVFRIHKRSHQIERCHACDECGKTFKSKDALSKHKKTHLGSRPYACDCGKLFTQKYSLRYHVTSRLCPLNNMRKRKSKKGTSKGFINGMERDTLLGDSSLPAHSGASEDDLYKSESVASFLSYVDEHMARMLNTSGPQNGNLGFQAQP